jgi:hypothetical protein
VHEPAHLLGQGADDDLPVLGVFEALRGFESLRTQI